LALLPNLFNDLNIQSNFFYVENLVVNHLTQRCPAQGLIIANLDVPVTLGQLQVFPHHLLHKFVEHDLGGPAQNLLGLGGIA